MGDGFISEAKLSFKINDLNKVIGGAVRRNRTRLERPELGHLAGH